MRDTTTGKLPFVMQPEQDIRWFCPSGYVHHTPDRIEVFVGGLLIGSYSPSDRGMRNLLLYALSSDERVKKTKVAKAFGVSRETIRLIEQQAEREGLGAVYARRQTGRTSVVTPRLQRRLERLFEEGATTRQAHEKVKRHMSHGTVRRVRHQWTRAKNAATDDVAADDRNEHEHTIDEAPRTGEVDHNVQQRDVAPLSLVDADETQGVLPLDDEGSGGVVAQDSASTPTPMSTQTIGRPATTEPTALVDDTESETSANVAVVAHDDDEPSNVGDANDSVAVAASRIRGGQSIQHVGSWLLIAMTAQLGLHASAARHCGGRVANRALRVAIDAFVVALAIGQKCVEGVRRLATPTAAVLLRTDGVPSASWVRRLLKRFAEKGGATWFHLTMAGQYLRRARQAEVEAHSEVVVFYVDNHLRPYSGKHKVRWTWRMQDKRVVPGAATDYYVHDEDGYPVLRVDVPSHGSLTDHLTSIARILREGVGDDVELLLVFDRAGAFPSQMAELRDNSFGFVTYERRPYPLRMATAFDRTLEIDGEQLRWCETRRKNLGKKRGRVRRISLLTNDGAQINLLGVSEQPAERLITAMLGDVDGQGGRWTQENGFKHGVERWGINQLDGRKIEHYAPDTIIPNPARRRLDRRLKLARIRDGLARRTLAHLADDAPQRPRVQRDLDEAIEAQAELEAQRAHTPAYAPLDETELAGKLVRHSPHYKTALDTIRLACVNAEADLAAELACHLPRPAEAKKALATLFAAPGDVVLDRDAIRISLRPAGSAAELEAFRQFLTVVNGWHLSLPDDARGRTLRFTCQTQ